MTVIEGTITRTMGRRQVEIPFYIDTYHQWGHDTLTLGENVDLLEALRDAAYEVS